MHHQIEYSFENDETLDCRISKGVQDEGRTGQYYGFMYIAGRKWAIVLMDGDEDPDMYKAECIEVAQPRWIKVDKL